MPRAANPDFSQEFSWPPRAVASDSGRAIGECGWGYGDRDQPRSVGLNAEPVSGWKLGLLIADFARDINSEIALLCGRQATATQRDLLVGLGAPTRRSRDHSKEGSLVARCLFMPSAWPSDHSIAGATISRPGRRMTASAFQPRIGNYRSHADSGR